jgi:Lambda phage tail tube protein, TTP
MTATTARVGFGSKVEISTDAEDNWTEIAEVTALTPPAATVNNPVATHMQSLAVERVPGRIVDYGQTTFSINWVPGSAADVLLRGLVTGAAVFSIRETFPNGVTWKISGLLASMTPATPMEDRMTCDITLDTTMSRCPASLALCRLARPSMPSLAFGPVRPRSPLSGKTRGSRSPALLTRPMS